MLNSANKKRLATIIHRARRFCMDNLFKQFVQHHPISFVVNVHSECILAKTY